MDFLQALRRMFLVAIVVALGAATSVYLAYDSFHASFGPTPLVDAIGTVFIVLFSFLMQRVVSLAFYRDYMLGMAKLSNRPKGRHSASSSAYKR
jgi:methyl-accepting chemotaxis protein